MELNLFKGKSKRTRIFTVITVAALAVVILLNFALYSIAVEKTVFLDMTKEGLYTLSDLMEEECDTIFDSLEKRGEDKKVKITFCTDPDYLMAAEKMRITYVLAIKLRNAYPEFVEVEAVNVRLNPTAVSQYKTTSLSKINSTDIIFSYGDRYRIVDGEAFWLEGTNYDSYYNGEYRVATLIRSVTAITQPVAYFLTGHGETVYDPDNPESDMSIKMASFADLLYERGLKIKLLDLSKEGKVPDDCALLVINNPTTDFYADPSQLNSFEYVSESEMLDRYLVKNQGAVIVATDYAADWDNLKNFKNFLFEWGFEIGDTLVKDTTASLTGAATSDTKIVATYNTSQDSFGYAIYGEYADLSSSPLTVFENAGIIKCAYGAATDTNEPGANNVKRHYASFLTTSNTAALYYKNPVTGEYVDKAGNAGKLYDLAAVAVRSELDSSTNETTYSYMFCVNSPSFLSGDLLGEASYANFDILSAVINNISRIDDHASMDLGGKSLNSLSMGGKKIISTAMSANDVKIMSNRYVNDDASKGLILIKYNYGLTTEVVVFATILAVLVPLSFAVAGIVVHVKRKHL